jgi:hypothetical protein
MFSGKIRVAVKLNRYIVGSKLLKCGKEWNYTDGCANNNGSKMELTYFTYYTHES